MARKATDRVTTIGIDIGMNTLHIIGLEQVYAALQEPETGLFFQLGRLFFGDDRGAADLLATRWTS